MAMDPVNQVRIGNYSIGNQQNGAPKKSEKEASETKAQNAQAQNVQNFNVDGMFNAMNTAGLQNMVMISKAESSSVNPADYLSQERISDIEAMMAKFESGVNTVSDVIEVEFPGVFTSEQKNALGAKIYAQE